MGRAWDWVSRALGFLGLQLWGCLACARGPDRHANTGPQTGGNHS